MESLGALVEGWVTGSGLTAATVARRAGVSGSTMHRVLKGQVDPAYGTLREIALACGLEPEFVANPLSDWRAGAAVRGLLEDGYPKPTDAEVFAWEQRLSRLAGDDPLDLVTAAAQATSPLERDAAVLLVGSVTIGRLASAGDASAAPWALSGAAGLHLPSLGDEAPPVTIVWCEHTRSVVQLLGGSELRPTQRADRATVAVIDADPDLFHGSFVVGLVHYAAPIQIVLDCIAQGGVVADEATKEAASW